MKLIVGLGNPGRKYEKTRHNVGFMVVDKLAQHYNMAFGQKKFQGHFGRDVICGQPVILLKPQTFMNLSGHSVKPLIDYYGINSTDVVVVYDDLDLPTGKLRLRQHGGHGGHNGIRSLIDQLGTKDFNRIRIGIDRPKQSVTVTDHVITNFTKSESEDAEEGINKAVDACVAVIEHDFLKAMNMFN